ncbi:MAG: bifunctional diguanylate cyclase/phosphodiesterase [Hyphomicrobiales bacterium]|nr:bifunctional diguanylate cyclase/phosphodiesterase [Hyphomicrobiales bacterium]
MEPDEASQNEQAQSLVRLSVVGAIMFVLAALFISHLAGNVDMAEAARERQAVQSALFARQSALAKDLDAVMARRSVGIGDKVSPFDSIAIYANGHAVPAGGDAKLATDPTLVRVAAEALAYAAQGGDQPLLRGDGMGPSPIFAYVPTNRGPILVAARPSAHGAPATIAAMRLDGDFSSSLAQVAGVSPISMETVGPYRTPDPYQVLLPGRGARLAVRLSPRAPGSRMLARQAPLLAPIMALFFMIAILQSRALRKDVVDRLEVSRRLAANDALSGLPNRATFARLADEAFARAEDAGLSCALLFLDLDRFKDVNDSHGHETGDKLILGVAERIKRILAPEDSLSRLGGDEFAILRSGVRGREEARNFAKRLVSLFDDPIDAGGVSLRAAASVGVAVSGVDAQGPRELMRLADVALYRAKSEGRNRYRMFDRSMNEELALRKIVEDDLRDAIARDELTLAYQPIVKLDGKRIVGVEALLRWNHPEKGVIPPSSFIPIAEERGLIVPLGAWVLRRALRDASRWPGVNVAVNVSPVQFRQRGFTEMVAGALAEAGYPPHELELEITEGVVVADADQAEDAMTELRTLGVRFALDDFGTGYSSLIYLRRFPFDKIKIDRSFLESMEVSGEGAILVQSMVHLGRELGLVVTAEGVENADQVRLLQAINCDELQGFHFSRPVRAEEIDALLAAEESPPRARIA